MVSDIPAGDGKIANPFLRCVVYPRSESGLLPKLFGLVSLDKCIGDPDTDSDESGYYVLVRSGIRHRIRPFERLFNLQIHCLQWSNSSLITYSTFFRRKCPAALQLLFNRSYELLGVVLGIVTSGSGSRAGSRMISKVGSGERKGAARHMIELVWPSRSPIPSGEEGVFNLFK